MHFFNENHFVIAVIGTHSFNSLQNFQSFGELPAFGLADFTYIVLQNGSDLISKCLTVPIEPLINLSETLMLSVNITFATTHNFNVAGRLVV